MPELPEVETIKRIVCPQLAGRTIETTEVRNAQVIAYPESKCFSKALSGQIISNMSRRGKFLTIQLENGDKLSLHLRMTGQLTVVPESEPVEKHTHLIFHLSGGSQLRYIDTHRFGRFWLLRKGEADTVTGQNKLGLEPTDPAITGEYLKTLLGKRKKTVKEMLLDQAVIAGIGNIYSDEILFAAKIYPGTACRILNEYDWAEKMIANHDLGKKPTETLSRVSKYYYENHYSKKEIRSLLDSFMLQCDPSASLVHWSDMLDKVAKNVSKFPLIRLDGVDITGEELAKIETLEGKQIRRLAFTLLCVAKYWDAASERNNGWVNTSDKEIMQMANINTSIKRQSLMFAELRDAGFIRFSKKIDNLNVQVQFIQAGETAIHIQDFRNLGYQYLKYYGGAYFECENCGLTVKAQSPAKGRPQKYCPSCAVEVKTRQTVNAVMRCRNAIKS